MLMYITGTDNIGDYRLIWSVRSVFCHISVPCLNAHTSCFTLSHRPQIHMATVEQQQDFVSGDDNLPLPHGSDESAVATQTNLKLTQFHGKKEEVCFTPKVNLCTLSQRGHIETRLHYGDPELPAFLCNTSRTTSSSICSPQILKNMQWFYSLVNYYFI